MFQEIVQGFRGSCMVLESSEGSYLVLEGLGRHARAWKGSVGLRMDLGIWRLQETPGWSGRFRGDPRGLGRIMEGISSLEFKF